MFDTIAVDLGGVATRFTPTRRLEALVEATGLAAEEIDARIFGSGLEARLERGEVDTYGDAVAMLLDALEGRLDASRLVDAWSRAFEPLGEVLTILAARPERVVLFTNNGPILEACLEGPLQSVRAVCDIVVCSWRLRAIKPERVAFDRFTATIGASANTLLLLDDSAANVDAARAAGWAAGQVTNAADLVAVLKKHRW